MRKEIIKIEMNWPTRAKETMTIGPFYKKIRRNAIQVSRKGNLIIISLGKDVRGKWGTLCQTDHTPPFDPKSKQFESQNFSNQTNFQTFHNKGVPQTKIESYPLTSRSQKPSSNTHIPRGILSSRNQVGGQNIFKTYGTDRDIDTEGDENQRGSTHEFRRMETLSSLAQSRAKSKDTLDFEDRRAGRDFERSTEYSLKRKPVPKLYDNELAQLSQRVRMEIQKEKVNLKEKKSKQVTDFGKGGQIEFHNSNLPSEPSRRESLRSQRSTFSRVSKVSRTKSPRILHHSQRKNKTKRFKNTTPRGNKTRGLKSTSQTRKRSNRDKNPKNAKVNSFHPAISKQIERQRRIERTLRSMTPRNGGSKTGSKSKQSSRSKTPKSQKTIRKKYLKTEGIPQKKIQKIIGKENNMLTNYEFLGPEDKVEVQDKIIEILKRKLLQEQKLRLERESELEAILKKDNMAVFDLEEQIINNDTDLGNLFSDRKNSKHRMMFGTSAEKYNKELFNQTSQLERDSSNVSNIVKMDGAQTDRPRYNQNISKVNNRPRKTQFKLKSKKRKPDQSDFLHGLEYSKGGYLASLKKEKVFRQKKIDGGDVQELNPSRRLYQ